MWCSDKTIKSVGQSYLDCCQNGLLSVFSLSGHLLFSQESVRKVVQINHVFNEVTQERWLA